MKTTVESHTQTTIQTHNAVSVDATTGVSNSAFIDTNGYTEIALTVLNDAATNSAAYAHWSNDGVTWHGTETFIASGSGQQRAGLLTTKSRYIRIQLANTDGSAHTMSAWAYLRA